MTSIDDDDESTTVMADILKVCKNGCTKEKIIEETHLSHDQLRRITAEIKSSYNTLNTKKSILQQIRDTYSSIAVIKNNNQTAKVEDRNQETKQYYKAWKNYVLMNIYCNLNRV
jgi:hypothetical protein